MLPCLRPCLNELEKAGVLSGGDRVEILNALVDGLPAWGVDDSHLGNTYQQEQGNPARGVV